MKHLILILIALALFSIPASAKTIGEVQEDMGVDKIAHITSGMACSYFVMDKMEGKKHSKRISWQARSALYCR